MKTILKGAWRLVVFVVLILKNIGIQPIIDAWKQSGDKM